MNARENRTVDGIVQRVTTYRGFMPATRAGVADGSIDVEMVNRIARNAWADTVGAAQRHYRPGSFTTFVAYEYTSSTDDRGNLHRNVIFRDADKLPALGTAASSMPTSSGSSGRRTTTPPRRRSKKTATSAK